MKMHMLATRAPWRLALFVIVVAALATYAQRGREANSDQATSAVWTPPKDDRAAYRDIVDYNIFRSDRQRIVDQIDRERNPPKTTDKTPPKIDPVEKKEPENPDAAWRLSGITHNEQEAVAYIEHTGTGELSRLTGPSDFSLGRITTIGYDSIVYLIDGESRVIHVGDTLLGERVNPAGAGTGAGTTTGNPSTKTGSVEDRIKALREQRARLQGQAPPEPKPDPESKPDTETPSDTETKADTEPKPDSGSQPKQ